eukprot:TRINITY_DN7596_c0_g4_i2.p1 TRINITY_DN7596_c0_g4~~TRINITY_DN7596_c0_g4_i2.p1  ORF type:complete len:246 (-),score=57.95 TRINITY_DN7596_c0_g4_i2:430-1167(-)
MGDYHKVYKGLDGETTEWDDIQRKLGNFPEKEPVWKPPPFEPKQDEPVKDKKWMDEKDLDELDELDDEFDDDQFLEEYRQKRISEMQQAAANKRGFGGLEFIRANEFVEKVTERSKQDNGVYVVVFLFQEGNAACAGMEKCLSELAREFQRASYVKIVSTECIPNYPDSNLPTVLIYHKGKCVKSLAGTPVFGGDRITPETVAFVLNRVGPICRLETDDEENNLEKEIKGLIKKTVEKYEEDDEE